MRRWIGLALLTFVGTAGWRIGEVLSPDALSMATGVLFGVMAGVPTALLVMAGSRRRDDERRNERTEESRSRPQQMMPMHPWAAPYAQQPPIVVLAGPQGMHHAPQRIHAPAGWFPQEPPVRHFTVVGEQEALIEDW